MSNEIEKMILQRIAVVGPRIQRELELHEPARRFPILGSAGRRTIAWTDAVNAWSEYHKRYPDQSLETIAARGGFSEDELNYWLGSVPEIIEADRIRRRRQQQEKTNAT